MEGGEDFLLIIASGFELLCVSAPISLGILLIHECSRCSELWISALFLTPYSELHTAFTCIKGLPMACVYEKVNTAKCKWLPNGLFCS